MNLVGSRYRFHITPFGVQEACQFCNVFFRNELNVYVWAEPFPQSGVLTGICHVCSFCFYMPPHRPLECSPDTIDHTFPMRGGEKISGDFQVMLHLPGIKIRKEKSLFELRCWAVTEDVDMLDVGEGGF